MAFFSDLRCFLPKLNLETHARELDNRFGFRSFCFIVSFEIAETHPW